MADIFISYSRKDRDRCTAIRNALEALGIDVWSDAGIGAGASWDREIEREIEAAKALLVLWSDDSVESDWVRNEARTGKVRDRLIAIQIGACALPLEFSSIQAELLPEGSEGTEHPAWLGMLARLGGLIGRPGLAEYARLTKVGTLDEWKRWLTRFSSDPLAGGVIDGIVERAMPDMRKQLASEKARRATLEAELTEHADAANARAAELAGNARELVALRHQVEQERMGRLDAEAEVQRFREVSGSKSGKGNTGLSDLGIVLEQRFAVYTCALMWIVALWFCWGPLQKLMNGNGALSDVFWLGFGIAALIAPACWISIKILRRKRALARLEDTAE